MDQAPDQLIYWDKHRIPVNLTLIFSVGVAIYGVYKYIVEHNYILVFAGLGVAAYTWFTNPRQYLIYPDAMYVMYGKPRTKVIPFGHISRIEMRTLATPDRLRVHPKSGRRVVVMARDPEAFYEKLDEAFTAYRRLHPEEFYADEPITDSRVVEGSVAERPTKPEDTTSSDDNRDNQAPY